MVKNNRRRFPRQNKEAVVQVLFTADFPEERKNWDDSMPVKIGNQSTEGLYLEMDCALQPGSNLSIKMVSPERVHPEDVYSMHDGKVIWCKEVADQKSRFGVGIKILRKVLRADVLSSRFVKTGLRAAS